MKISKTIFQFRLYDIWVYLLAIGMLIGNTGIWVMPNLNMQYLISQNLTKIPFEDPNAHYLFTNYFQPLLFKLFRGASLDSYFLFALVITFCFVLIFLIWFVQYHGKETTLALHKLFAAITFSTFFIPFYWIGMDGMTLLLILLVFITRTQKVMILFALSLGLQHFEQGFVAFALLLGTLIVYLFVSREKTVWPSIKNCFLILMWILVGKCLLVLWFWIANIELGGNRNSYMQTYGKLYFQMWLLSWPVILWSLLGTGWLLCIRYIKKIWPLFLAVIVTFFITMIVGDQTRVGAIVLFPSLMYWVMIDKTIWRDLSQRMLLMMIITYLILPIYVVWGVPHHSMLKADEEIFQKIKNGTFALQNEDLLKPFTAPQKSIALSKQSLKEYNAKIECAEKSLHYTKNQPILLPINVTNNSAEVWKHANDSQGRYGVFLSYHIKRIDSSRSLIEGQRVILPHDVSSGTSVSLMMPVTRSLEVGDYVLEVDMVHEGITWFSEQNPSTKLTLILEIR
ncbi:MAG: hypothetical protein PHR87_07650 [Sulfurospirillaceae bacterium]|nr:hypothetical protein [Sulfurospirillaceae bacterium]